MPRRRDKSTTIIRREEIVAGGHHGGAWKVAYADFVTAMMAFFLLLWLLNATTEAQKRGLADYFSPTVTSTRGTSGAGKPLAGQSPFLDGEAISDRGTLITMNAHAPPVDVEDDGSDTPAIHIVHAAASPGGPGTQPGAGPQQAAAAAARVLIEQRQFAGAALAIQKAVAADPALAPLAHQLSVDVTPEGLRVQLRDDDRQPMFATGSATPDARAVAMLRRLEPILARMSQPISIAGYTDAAPYSGTGRTNWDLSADRANATRRILTQAGLPDARIRDVAGHADRDLLLPAVPLAAANRRIAIMLWRTAPAAQ